MRGFHHKFAIVPHTFGSLQIEGDASVEAAIADVPKECHPVLMFIQEPIDFAEIVAHLFNGHSRIFPTWPGVFHARSPARTDAVFAYFPNQFLIVLVLDQPFQL